jgi:hypothetical protein
MKTPERHACAGFRGRRTASSCLLALVLLGRSIPASGGIVEAELTFDPASLRFAKWDEYDVVKLDGCESTCIPGEPQLPARNVLVLLPPGARVERVDIVGVDTLSLPDGRSIRPAQPPAILSHLRGDGMPAFVAPKPSVYASDLPHPPEIVVHAGTSRLGGYTVASFTVFPLRYVPAERRCLFHSGIRFRTTYTTDPLPALSARRLSPSTGAPYRDIIGKLVSNPGSIDDFSPPSSSFSKKLLKDSGERNEYVIITDQAFVSAFQPLADWKTKKGVPAQIVETSWIYANYAGVDSQEKIRAFVRDAFTNRGAIWVLLGGDIDKVPVRKAYALDCKAGFDSDENNIPCDLYYADLDGTWNAGGKPDVFGEVADEVDMLPEVFVGRAPASSVAQAETFVRKILAYEKNPPADYILTMLFAAEILWSSPFTDQGIAKDRIDEEFVPYRFDITKLYQRDGNESPATVLAAMNLGKHIINHDGHAWYDVLQVGSGQINNAGIDGLTNGPEHSILYSIGCWSTAFDRDSIAERFVNNPNGGGVAFIGNSRYGWGALGEPGFGYSDRFDRGFYEFLFDRDTYRIGENLALSKAVFIPFSREENVYRWCQYEINLIGDPEMPIWTDQPATLVVHHPPGVPVGSSTFPVTVTNGTAALAGAMVCVMKDGEVYETAPTDESGRAVFTISPASPAGKLDVTVTAHNFLPYEGTVDVLSETGFIEVSACSIDDSSGNGDGKLTPGESVRLQVELKNYGNRDAGGVTATLEAVSADVTVTDGTASYGDIAAGQSASTVDAFSISVPATRANGETVYLRLTATDSLENRWESTLALQFATPVLVCSLLDIEDHAAGNGNGLPEPGETVALLVCIENGGLATARGISASFAADDAFLEVVRTACDIGDLPPGTKGVGITEIAIAGACPSPRFPTISATVNADEGYEFTGSLPLTIGPTGFLDGMESGGASWSLPGGGNLWHLSSHRAHGSSTSWYCGIEGQWSYTNNNTSILLGAPISLGRNPVLSFWIWYDLALYGTTGLFVEVDDGTGWEKLDFIGSGGALHPLLMGQDWMECRHDLARYAPGTSVELRFRFVSDSEAAGEGVYLDDIAVGSSGETTEAPFFIRGDEDADGTVTISDPIAILSYLFLDADEPACFDAADPNDDGAIDVSDAVYLLLYLFAGLSDPALDVCGTDATPDAIDCQTPQPCSWSE